MRLLPYGEDAVLVEVDAAADVLTLHRRVAGRPGVVDAIPAARTLLVQFTPAVVSVTDVAEMLRSGPDTTTAAGTDRSLELAVCYDGADLAAVADEVGLSVTEVIIRHSAAHYVVAFCGFAPGFAYLSGLDPTLHVGRLDEPRSTVPAGSVAIAGEFSGVYPRSSPGGWRLLGRTAAPLWNPVRTPPALLTPGIAVRFVPV